MTTYCKENLLCDKCIHSKVCSFKEEFKTATKSLDRLKVYYDDGRIIFLDDIEWVDAQITCRYFMELEETE